MRASRRTQPYRGGAGPIGPAKTAMQGGRTLFGQNPADAHRTFRRKTRRRHGGLFRAVTSARAGMKKR